MLFKMKSFKYVLLNVYQYKIPKIQCLICIDLQTSHIVMANSMAKPAGHKPVSS